MKANLLIWRTSIQFRHGSPGPEIPGPEPKIGHFCNKCWCRSRIGTGDLWFLKSWFRIGLCQYYNILVVNHNIRLESWLWLDHSLYKPLESLVSPYQTFTTSTGLPSPAANCWLILLHLSTEGLWRPTTTNMKPQLILIMKSQIIISSLFLLEIERLTDNF